MYSAVAGGELRACNRKPGRVYHNTVLYVITQLQCGHESIHKHDTR